MPVRGTPRPVAGCRSVDAPSREGRALAGARGRGSRLHVDAALPARRRARLRPPRGSLFAPHPRAPDALPRRGPAARGSAPGGVPARDPRAAAVRGRGTLLDLAVLDRVPPVRERDRAPAPGELAV